MPTRTLDALWLIVLCTGANCHDASRADSSGTPTAATLTYLWLETLYILTATRQSVLGVKSAEAAKEEISSSNCRRENNSCAMTQVGADSARASTDMQHRKKEDGMKDSLNLQITHFTGQNATRPMFALHMILTQMQQNCQIDNTTTHC